MGKYELKFFTFIRNVTIFTEYAFQGSEQREIIVAFEKHNIRASFFNYNDYINKLKDIQNNP